MPDPDEKTDLDFLGLEEDETLEKEIPSIETEKAQAVEAAARSESLEKEFKGVSMQRFKTQPEGEPVEDLQGEEQRMKAQQLLGARRREEKQKRMKDPRYKQRLLAGGRSEWVPKRAFVDEIAREEKAAEEAAVAAVEE